MKAVFTLLIMVSLISCSKNEQVIQQQDPQPAPLPGESKSIVETEPPVLTAITKRINNNIGGYYQALPAHYKETTFKYPLLIFVHGAGQRGDGAKELPLLTTEGITERLSKKQFPPSFTSGKNIFSFVILSPQFNEFESVAALESFINFAVKTYRIDASRIYLAGMSMGGRMVTDYMAAYPNKVSAFVSMAGVCKQDENFISKAKSIAGGGSAGWVLHNNGDEAMPPEDAEALVKEINNFGPAHPAILSMLSPSGEAKHDSWTRASDPAFKVGGKNIYEWMLGFKK
jgi:predicted peptidase